MDRARILKNIVNLAVKILPRGASVLLFGSQARGDFSEDSDWDLLILIKGSSQIGLFDRGRYSLPIYEMAAEMGININPVIYTNDEWEKRKFTLFYKNVTNDAVKIWG